jgi:hypothetical protein
MVSFYELVIQHFGYLTALGFTPSFADGAESPVPIDAVVVFKSRTCLFRVTCDRGDAFVDIGPRGALSGGGEHQGWEDLVVNLRDLGLHPAAQYPFDAWNWDGEHLPEPHSIYAERLAAQIEYLAALIQPYAERLCGLRRRT